MFGLRNKNRFVISTPGYNPDQALAGRTFSNCYTDKLAVLFAPWHGAGPVYEPLAKRLERNGYSILTYEFSPEILKADIAQVIASFGTLRDRIAADLSSLYEQNGYQEVHLIGTSLGNLPLALAAEKFTHFTELSMAGAGSNLARATWEGRRTQDIRDGFIAQGITEAQLDTAWAGLAPKNHVRHFKGKRINLVVSLKDHVIPTRYQLEYAAALKAAGVDVRVIYTRLGHYASIIRFCLAGRFE
jgi:hypothetical protein